MEQTTTATKKRAPLLVIVPFFGVLILIAVLGLLLPDRAASTAENRALTQRPVMDFSDIGALTAAWTDYFVDQFPMREQLLKVYSALELAQHKRFTRNTYVTEDGWLMTYIYPVSAARWQSLAETVAGAQAAAGIPFFYAVIPQKNDMLAELAAPYLDNTASDQNKSLLLDALARTAVQPIDVGAYFLDNLTLEEREALYYKTDFHWNERGAYLAAQEICAQMEAAGRFPLV